MIRRFCWTMLWVWLAACANAQPRRVTRDLSALRFTAGSALEGQAPRMLTAWAVVRNSGAMAVELRYGACALQIHLWRSAARSGPPVWRSERRAPVRPKHSTQQIAYACPAILLSSVIAPGDTLPFKLSVPFPEVLADSLPDGEYWVGVDLSLLNDSLGSARRDIPYVLPAGDLMLRRAPDRPPTVRLENGIRFEAATRVSKGPVPDADTIHTFVMVTNTTDSTRVLQIDRGSPIMVSIFRSAEDRDGYPPPRPVYTLFTGSGFLATQRVTLGAGKKWLFEQSAPVNEVVRRAGRGHLYFLASVTGTTLTLAAGDVELP